MTREEEINVKKKKMNSIVENIEQNAAKYNSDKDNLKERFIEVSNKCNDLLPKIKLAS